MTLLQRLTRARREYLRHPTRATLRAYLILKARRAVTRGDALAGWDPRMCRYYGVSAHVNEGCRRAIVRGYARGLVPTSTLRLPVSATTSFHQRRDEHGNGQGVDLGLIETQVGTVFGRDRLIAFQADEHARQRRQGGRIGGCDLVELIGPDDRLTVLRDRETDLVHGSPLERQHDAANAHVHEAYVG